MYSTYMEKYVSHVSAAKMWDIPCFEAVFGRTEQADSVDITVTERKARYRTKNKKIHSSELVLPVGAIRLHKGKMVASPELLFLELASKLSIHRLILLGLQLCSHPPGNPFEAITSKQKLNIFLEKTPGHIGHRKALRAAKYTENGSASIMESLAYMILTLPHSLGGYGLNDAVFNYEVIVKSKASMSLGEVRCYTDLYYKHAKLAVEYESFAFHSSPSKLGKDALRSSLLERQGVKVMHLSTIQLYDRDACRVFAFNLAARLGKRMQIRAKSFDEKHALLRALLPVGKPVTELNGGEL